MLVPGIPARIEERYNFVRVWVGSFAPISTPFVAVSARQGEVVGVVSATG